MNSAVSQILPQWGRGTAAERWWRGIAAAMARALGGHTPPSALRAATSPCRGGSFDVGDERVLDVHFDEHSLMVDLLAERTISAPLAWYPRLLCATAEDRATWELCGGGYGIHWPQIDEDLSTEGLLRGAPAPKVV
ncbi:MAG TPA: DUF2442 domain-containing protein [Novosphingobium sp.]|nr:DUF2442 domain-containing protein [Novosphingobium sp.]